MLKWFVLEGCNGAPTPYRAKRSRLLPPHAVRERLTAGRKISEEETMNTVVGIFQSGADAEYAINQLRAIGSDDAHITLLRPGTSDEQVESKVPTSDSESPGVGEAMGGAVGGALGAASGATLGLAVAGLLLPGVGPIMIAGALGAALLGAGGAMAGVQAGEALEEALTNGLPHDELFVYEDALREGRSVVLVWVNEDEPEERVRNVLKQAGAESIDAARDNWWLGLRDDEESEYKRAGGNFRQDETSYRRGFEAALHKTMRGRTYEDAQRELREKHQGTSAERPFRAGFDRGQGYLKSQAKNKARGTSATS